MAGAEFARFTRAFERAILPLRKSPEPLGVLFSGGLDSSILAWELRDAPGVSLWTIGAAGAPDLSSARSASAVLGRPWTGIELSPEEVARAVRRFPVELNGLTGPAYDVAVGVGVAVQAARPGRLAMGQGADELFLGYAHFRSVPPALLEERADQDLERLREQEWPRAIQIAQRVGKALYAPFLDDEVVAAARALPISTRAPGEQPKAWLRRWAIGRGLPEGLAMRPKRAFQYGSRVERMLRQLEAAERRG